MTDKYIFANGVTVNADEVDAIILPDELAEKLLQMIAMKEGA